MKSFKLLLAGALIFTLSCHLALAAARLDETNPSVLPTHPFSAIDLAMLERVGDPQLSPDGRYVAFTVTSSDLAINKSSAAVYVSDIQTGAGPVKVAKEGRLPRWSSDGRSLFYLATLQGVSQLWRLNLSTSSSTPGSGDSLMSAPPPVQVTEAPLDVESYKLSPDGKAAILVYAVFADCSGLPCTEQRLLDGAKTKATGALYTRLFVRHWNTWANGRRKQLFLAAFMPDGRLSEDPVLLSRGIDGDIPSSPFGTDGEFSFSPDSSMVYFDARVAGRSEPWSTNFDIYSVPADASAGPRDLTAGNLAWDANPVPSPDGKTLYYTAMKEPGFESDRAAVMALDLLTGNRRQVAPNWDRTAGSLSISKDGSTLYTSADDFGQHPLFAINVTNGTVTKISPTGTVEGYSVAGSRIIVARDDFNHPTDLYEVKGNDENEKQITNFNAGLLMRIRMGDAEDFVFKGWHGQSVHGFLIHPVDYDPKKKYPVAFIIHGGPQISITNGWNYRWNPQTYAGAGLAVLIINFHGSTGYGQAFTNSISGDWNGKSLVDLKDGWNAATLRFSILDKSRACAVGGSYGGYMVYWIAGRWSEPWKCLVDHDGIFDTRTMYYGTDELWFEEKENGGTQYDNPSAYERVNPLVHVKDWRVPMLIIHSDQDFRVPESQGIEAFTAMQRRGIPSELLRFPDEGHVVSKPQNLVQWNETILGWINRWTSATQTREN